MAGRLELVKCEERGGDEEASGDGVIPAQVRTEIEGCEDTEDGDSDDLLNYLELHGREAAVTQAVGGNLEAVLEKGDAPTNEDYLP